MNPSEALAALADRYWAFETFEIPMSAALAGLPIPDGVLFRESLADHERRHRRAGELLDALAAIPLNGLQAQDCATHRLLQRELSGLRAQHAVQAHLRPWLIPGGPDFNAMFWANSTSIASVEAARRHVATLAGLPAFLRDVQQCIEAGLAQGWRYPRVVLERAAANTRGIVAALPEQSPWLSAFSRSPLAQQPAVQAQAAAALQVVRGALQPALQDWLAFLQALPSRETLSCAEGPGGDAYYRVFVRHFTTTEDTPEAIHQLGLREVDRILGEMQALAAEAGFAGDLAGYRRFLTTDPQFVAPSAEALREQMERLCKRIDRRIPDFFSHLPRITYGVESIPEALSAQMPLAYAQPSPADRSAAGVFWVSGIPSKCPSYLHVSAAVHEAWPGHLMHLALMGEQDRLPAFRRHGAVKYTVTVEGWALYCETLGAEMGLYRTPHEHFGRADMELWRAVRLVVDTGLHAHGWSREEAVAYMAGRLTLSHEAIEAEVDRYAGLPAQALGYQIGNLAMRRLRQHAEHTLGERFDLRRFHEVVTTAGTVTVPVLEDLVDDWLQREHEAATEHPTESATAAA